MANLRVDKITSTETFEKTGSVQFDGSGDVLTVPNSADFRLGNGDFTIECWFYYKGALSSNRTLFGLFENSSARRSYHVELRSDGTIRFEWWPDGSTGNSIDTAASTVSISTWHHYAATRTNGIITQYLNGESVASSSVGTSSFYDNTDDPFRIGALNAAVDQSFSGHISNFRIIKGVALYTSNFKPSMRELEVIPGTSLLACQSKTDASLEKTGKTITVTGNAVASELTPGILTPIVKSGAGSAITGSVEFSGGTSSNPGDYLTVPNTTDLRLGSSDFTVEAWVNFSNGAVSNGVIAALWDNTNNQRSWNLYFDRSGNNLYFAGSTNGSSGNNNVSTSIDIEDSNWYHVAASRSGSTIKLFVNGIESGSNTSVGTYYDNTTDLITIGAQNHDNISSWWKGFISNLRIVKGTALYTDDFIPPTRELKKVPGTVLLCCQDPNNPLTEATGKTITGYGDLQRADGVELIANGHFSSNTDNWTAVGNASLSTSSGQIVLTGDGSTAGGGAAQGFATIVGKKYVLKYEAFSGTISAGQIRIGTSANSFSITFDNSVSASAHDDITFVATSTTTYVTLGLNAGVATSGTFKYDNVSVTLVDGSNKGSNFTPQVGDDRKVTFEGVTKINSDAYFYFPTGDTITRESRSGRGVFAGGLGAPSPLNLNVIDYVSISSMGNAFSFGDLNYIGRAVTGLGNQTRGIIAGGSTPANVNTIEYITIATTGNAQDFGDLTDERRGAGACASNTRGIIAGGKDNASPSNKLNTVDYITIASTGDALSFGELNFKSVLQAGVSSPTRGVFAGGYTPSSITSIDFITITSTGNGSDFGDLTLARYGLGGVASPVRGVFAGGYVPGAAYTNVMDYITIASTGNAQDFGDTSPTQGLWSGASNGSRGIFAGGNTPSRTNGIQYVTISTTGDAQDFGDLIENREQLAGLSDSHGGLG